MSYYENKFFYHKGFLIKCAPKRAHHRRGGAHGAGFVLFTEKTLKVKIIPSNDARLMLGFGGAGEGVWLGV